MDDNYLIIGAMGRDRLGDLSQFDGHTKAPWNTDHNPWIFRRFNDGDGRRWTIPLFQAEKASSVDKRLAAAAPDLLAALKESRKEVEELRERIEKAIQELREEKPWYKVCSHSELVAVAQLAEPLLEILEDKQ
ncbi:MAG: hypothetical protein CMF59_16720 [Leptospiraceae bacterium]|nr:hypothetical protein [Leptospiraceae bacterium]